MEKPSTTHSIPIVGPSSPPIKGKMSNLTVAIADDHDDGSNAILTKGAKIHLPENEVPVTFNFADGEKDLLGTATLRQYRDEIRADITWFGERVDTLKTVPRVFLSIDGMIMKAEGDRVLEFSVRRIQVHTMPNSDKRIGPWTMYQLLGEPDPNGGNIRDY